MRHLLRSSTTLPLPLEEVFAFFADASNLERITPRELRFRILTPPPIEMRAGTLIDYQLRLAGIPFRWRTRIACWEPPHRFVDEQLRGPYREWIHEHRFEEIGEGTSMTDTVHYRLPLWPLGEVGRALVRAQLNRIFDHREKAIRAILSGERCGSA